MVASILHIKIRCGKNHRQILNFLYKDNPGRLFNLSGLIIVFCGSNFTLTDSRGRLSLQGLANILMRRSLFPCIFVLFNYTSPCRSLPPCRSCSKQRSWEPHSPNPPPSLLHSIPTLCRCRLYSSSRSNP